MNVRIQQVPMERLGALIAASMLVAALSAAPPVKKKSHPSTLTKTSQRVGNRSGKWTSRRRAVASAPSYQLHPDPERYQEIQKALADRGYFKGPVNGTWSDDSVDAMKRFQSDQKLEQTDGKIDAKTLSGLGLGPKHDGSTAPGSSPAPSAAAVANTTPPLPAPSPQ